MSEQPLTGIVTNIQRFSIHDGPGIRTTVFLKGCNLHCFWCHNPETLGREPELQLFLDKCIGCGACLEACQQGAHVLIDGERQFLRALCTGCGACADTCYAEALVLVGECKTVDDVVAEVMSDKAFYDTSDGGVTLSGGEPLLQLAFSRAILERCQAEGVHTAIETALNWPWERVASILPVTDMVMFDIKHMNSDIHRDCTGVPNERILANIERLGSEPQLLIARTPVIPGVNDNAEDIRAIATFAARLPNLLYYELLPFHPMATGKYDSLGIDYRARGLDRPSSQLMETLSQVAAEAGIPVRHG